MPAWGWKRLGARADDLPVPDLGLAEVAHQRPAGDRDRLRIEQVLDLAQHGQQPAGPVEVLHQEACPPAAGSTSSGTSAPVRSKSSWVELDAEPAGDREQVDDGVRRAADRGQRDDRVEERAAA